MRSVILPGTDIQVSRLSFGTASLHHLPVGRWRQELLSEAFECGFTHFDTAPYYGFGLAEEELGRFVKDRPNRVTIASKIGLYPPAGASSSAASVWGRKAFGKIWPKTSRPVIDWSPQAASGSLDCSLRRLGVDTLDLLLLHEPVSTMIGSDELLDWLKTVKRMGKIRAWGLAGNAANIEAWTASDHPLGMVLQVRDSLEVNAADSLRKRGRNPQITYGYLAASSCYREIENPYEILRKALSKNSEGTILVSTRKKGRVRGLSAAAH